MPGQPACASRVDAGAPVVTSARATDGTGATLLERLEAELPQTQCGRCGQAGCTPFAAALVAGRTRADGCPPGGRATAVALAGLLGRPLDAVGAAPADEPVQLACVREADCIGCTKCIEACPVDAIVGARGAVHGVMAIWCTGCALCLPVCPTDCIVLEPAATVSVRPTAPALRARYQATMARRAQGAARGRDAAGYLDVADATAAELRARVLAAVQRRRSGSA